MAHTVCRDVRRTMAFGASVRHACILPDGHSYEHECQCGDCWCDE